MIPDFPDFADHNTTHAIATGAVLSPLWLQYMSDTAQAVLPILGVLWLLYQAAVFTYKTFFRKPKP